MRIFLAGGTGAIGRRLIPFLRQSGHEVTATTRSNGKLEVLRNLGAKPVLLDAFDRRSVEKAVIEAQSDVVMHQMTALANLKDFRKFESELALTNRLRTEGAEILLQAAQSAGAKRFIAQSYSGWPNERTGSRIKTESDPLDPNPPDAMKPTVKALIQLEQMVTNAQALTGIVLRYGSFYGPGTGVAPDGILVEALQSRQFPIIGSGTGIWSWVHIDDAARATVLALEYGESGIYNIVDDEPAEVATWLPVLADAVKAKAPRRIPAWLGRLFIGEAGVSMMTRSRGSSNAKAKQALHWQPSYASWREGFHYGLTDRQPKV
ncbi:MAG TPA: NAD(P)-dependent oxidoreductase [Edaphobacter sp.]|nr:NAD(P)-dependent oxidoreductase [Edaphobacter sp.]